MVEDFTTKDHIHIYVFKSGDEFNQTEKCDRSNKYIVSISNPNHFIQKLLKLFIHILNYTILDNYGISSIRKDNSDFFPNVIHKHMQENILNSSKE